MRSTACAAAGAEIEIDIHEAAPAEVLEMLYARQANIGLIAADSVGPVDVGFRKYRSSTIPMCSRLRARCASASSATSDADAGRRAPDPRQLHPVPFRHRAHPAHPANGISACCRPTAPCPWPHLRGRRLGAGPMRFGVCLLPALTASCWWRGRLMDRLLRHRPQAPGEPSPGGPISTCVIAPFEGFIEALGGGGRNIVLRAIWPVAGADQDRRRMRPNG